MNPVTYKKIGAEDIANLNRIIPDRSRIHVGDAIHPDYQHDELHALTGIPEILIEPISANETAAVVKYAASNNIPITPRGQGTGLVGGAVCLHGGIMLSLQKMNRILELDEDNLILTVEPGVLLMEITEYLEQKMLFYPPDPGEKSATIGGNISTNAGGMRAVKYGVTRDFIRALEVVLPDGEIVTFGGKVAKNSSGYSLKDLIIGSEGTLGIVTKAFLRLLPLPGVVTSMLIPFPDLESAIVTVPKIMKARQIPTAVEFMQKEVITAAAEYLGRQFPDSSSSAYLLVSYDGPTREFVDLALDEAAEIALANGAVDAFYSDTPERQDAVWKTRGTFLEAIKASTTEMDECDVVVPRSEIAAFIKFCHGLQEQYGVRIMSFGHAGDGNLHIYALRDNLGDDDWLSKLHSIFEAMYQRAKQVGGKVSGEHGIGYAKKYFLEESEVPEITRLFSQIKKAFDPRNIMNPGKVAG
jgi:glycolate oxidase